LRKRLLTDVERKTIQEYLDADGDRTAPVRNTARYARQIDFKEIYADIKLIKAFRAAYAKRNGA
jgi:hypothetical protein